MKTKTEKSKLGQGTLITNQSGEHLGCPNGCVFYRVELTYEIHAIGSISLECNEGSDYEEIFEEIGDSDLAHEIRWNEEGFVTRSATDSPRCGECRSPLQIVPNNSIRLIQELAEEEDEGKHGK